MGSFLLLLLLSCTTYPVADAATTRGGPKGYTLGAMGEGQSSNVPAEEDLRERERMLDEYPRQYALWKPEEISSKVVEWASEYPDLVHVTTSQEAYGLPRAGGANDCPHDEGGDGCLNYILTIQDFVAHPDGSESSNHLPEVFWSGCVHGKRVGWYPLSRQNNFNLCWAVLFHAVVYI
jgi:hypothetical protein